jgi:hypothetical protein
MLRTFAKLRSGARISVAHAASGVLIAYRANATACLHVFPLNMLSLHPQEFVKSLGARYIRHL